MKKYLLSLAFCILGYLSFSQNFNWAFSTFGGGGASTCSDDSGNVYTIGTFWTTVDFDPGEGIYNLYNNSGYSNGFISKLDRNGNFKWAKKLEGNSHISNPSIAVDDSGNVYISGGFDGKIDFDPDTTMYKLSSTGYTSVFVSKLNPSGSLRWVKLLTSNDGIVGWGLAVDNKGNVFTTGYFEGVADLDPNSTSHYFTSYDKDVFISKLNNDGDFLWGKMVSGNGQTCGLSIKTDEHGNSYTTGYFSGIIDFDPGTGKYNLTSSGSDMFILKLDVSGNFQKATRTGAKNYTKPQSINLDHFGNIYTTGTFDQTTDFDPGSGIYNLSTKGSTDIFISKLDSLGNLVWAKSIGGSSADYSKSIEIDDSGNVFIAGTFVDTADFDPGSGVYRMISTPKPDKDGSQDIFITKLTASGNFVWAKKIGGISIDFLNDICIDKKGGVYAVGAFCETVDFDPGSDSYNMTIANKQIAGSDGFMLKLSSCNIPTPGKIKGLSSVCTQSSSKYSIDTIFGAETYIWSVPYGSSIINGQNTPNVEIKFGSVSGVITLIVKNTCGKSKQVLFSVQVNALPNVGYIVSPSSTVCKGSDITLNGTGAITYQWSDGKTNGVSFLADSSAYYYVSGVNSNGCKNTSFVFVTVNPSPVFSSIIPDQSGTLGSFAKFFAEATGNQSGYQWQQNSGTGFMNLDDFGQYSGSKTKTLTINNISLNQDNYGFRSIARIGPCTDTTNIFKLIVNCTVNISKEPENRHENSSGEVEFTVETSNSTASYQWQQNLGKGFINLSDKNYYLGVTSKKLTIKNIPLSLDKTEYRCIISNGKCMDTSAIATLSINCPISISKHPLTQSVNSGSQVKFGVASPLAKTYQWQQNSGTGFIDLSNFGQYSGVNTDSLTIKNVSISQDNYGYRCIAFDGGCSDTSKVAILSVETVGIKKIQNQKSFSIYPNPANNFITIESSQTPNNLPFIITDQIGKQILKGELNSQTSTVDIDSLAPGLYFLKIGEENTEVFKIVKQ